MAVFFLSCLVAANVIGLYVHREYRRAKLNRQLIEAITSGNDALALDLLKRGADGTANKAEEVDDRPSVVGWIKALLHRRYDLAMPPKSVLMCYYSPRPRDPAFTRRDSQELPLRLLDAGLPDESRDTAGALFAACEEGHDRVVAKMLKLGADPNVKRQVDMIGGSWISITDARDICGYSHPTGFDRQAYLLPLLIATPRCTDILLRHHANVNSVDHNGNTALINACAWGESETAMVLLAQHADVAVRNQKGETALPNAAHACKLELVQALVAAGSSANEASNNGVTSLMLSVDNPDGRVLAWLIAHGADVNATTKVGLSPLLVACSCASLDVVKTLVHHGADLHQRDIAGETAEMVACDHENLPVLQWLLTQHSDLRATTHVPAKEQRSPLKPWLTKPHRPGETLLDYLRDEHHASANDAAACNILDALIMKVRELIRQAPQHKVLTTVVHKPQGTGFSTSSNPPDAKAN